MLQPLAKRLLTRRAPTAGTVTVDGVVKLPPAYRRMIAVALHQLGGDPAGLNPKRTGGKAHVMVISGRTLTAVRAHRQHLRSLASEPPRRTGSWRRHHHFLSGGGQETDHLVQPSPLEAVRFGLHAGPHLRAEPNHRQAKIGHLANGSAPGG